MIKVRPSDVVVEHEPRGLRGLQSSHLVDGDEGWVRPLGETCVGRNISPISMHNDTFIVLPRRTQSVPDKTQHH